MTPSLPPHPSLEHLKNEAKAALKAHKAGDASCCDVLRKLNRFAEASDADILAVDVPLKEVQFALAMHYGFKSWSLLKAAVAQTSGKAVEVAGLSMRADCMRQDTFSIVICKAAELLGVEADYEAVHFTSTNAFSPCINTREDCTSWWHLRGKDRALDYVAARLGLVIRHLDLPDFGFGGNLSDDERQAAVKRMWDVTSELVQDAMDAGSVVICGDDWDTNGPHGFVPWLEWGIITRAPQGQPLVGATMNGHSDNPVADPSTCFVVSGGSEPSNDHDCDIEALRMAVDRFHGRGQFERGWLVFGVEAMDRWIEHMATVQGFCAPCFESAPDRAWGDANDTASTVMAGARTVSSYLESRIDAFPEPARQHIGGVARRYGRMGEILSPFTGPKGLYRGFIGDLDKQKEHAETLLVPVKTELAAAADDIEKALAAMGDQQ